MSISKFIEGAIREFAYQNYPVAMACTCIALDATAKKENPNMRVGERCMAFIDSYLNIISVVGTGGATCAMPGAKLCPSDPENPGTFTPIQEIIYKSIRNCLIHEAALAAHVSFTPDAFLGVRHTKLEISHRMIIALLLAVAASTENFDAVIDNTHAIVLDNRIIPFNDLFGDCAAVCEWLNVPQVE